MTERRWLVERQDGRRVGRALTRQAAMNRVDKPYQYGRFLVRHELTGEAWERRDGSWIKTRDADPVGRSGGPPATEPLSTDSEPPAELWWQR